MDLDAVPQEGNATLDGHSKLMYARDGMTLAGNNMIGSASVSRISDTTQRLAWTRNHTAAAPWVAVQVERQVNTSAAAWTRLTNDVPGADTTWDDTTTGADAAYRYRVRSANFTGESAWATTDWVYTTPKPPTGFSLSRSGTTITAAWQKGSTWADRYEVQIAENGGAWTAWDSTTALSVTRTAASTSTWAARVRTITAFTIVRRTLRTVAIRAITIRTLWAFAPFIVGIKSRAIRTIPTFTVVRRTIRTFSSLSVVRP